MFERRGLIIHPEEISLYWRDLLIDSGLNNIAVHPVGGRRAAISLVRLLEEVKTDKFRNFAESLISRGFSFGYEMHAMSWLVPRDLFGSRPEWFRMNENMQRVCDFNICPSNMEALDFLKDRSELLAKLLPYSGNRYFFWLDDVKNTSCHCNRCRDLTPSDQALILHNNMLEGIKRFNPLATECYLAYQDTMPAPENVRPLDGIFLEYAPIMRNTDVPINDENCPENRGEASAIDGLMKFFGRENSQALEYWIDNSRFCGWKLPYKKLNLNASVIQADARFYAEKGFSSATSFACYLGEDYAKIFGAPPIKEYARALCGG